MPDTGFTRGRGTRGRGTVEPRGRGGALARGRGGAPPRGRGMRGGRGGPRDDEEWVPVTKLGKLVHAGKITSLNEVFFYSLPIKEHQIVDKLLGPDVLREELLAVYPVQKMTTAGQRTRFKAVSVIGDQRSLVGLGIKCAKEASLAIRGAVVMAKLSLRPTRKGFWGSKEGQPHTVPGKISGKCGSVRVRLIPAPRGTGIVAPPTARTVLQLAGYEDVLTNSTGQTRTKANFAKAAFAACAATYGYLTPDLWADYSGELGVAPFVKHAAAVEGA